VKIIHSHFAPSAASPVQVTALALGASSPGQKTSSCLFFISNQCDDEGNFRWLHRRAAAQSGLPNRNDYAKRRDRPIRFVVTNTVKVTDHCVRCVHGPLGSFQSATANHLSLDLRFGDGLPSR
jgi:hypothetical protein